MHIYNLRKAKYAKELVASGVSSRWNREDEFVIYARSTRALAYLESLVLHNNINLYSDYKMLEIAVETGQTELHDTNEKNSMVQDIDSNSLPHDWRRLKHYGTTQQLGSDWYQKCEKLLLRVPSVLIPQEYNFLINTRHPDFEMKVSILRTEEFTWNY